MPALISGTSHADAAGTIIATDSEVEGLGVRALLTTLLAEYWRTGVGPVRALDITLPASRAVRVVVLHAPRDGLLPEAGATIAASLGTSALGGTDAGSLPAGTAFAMPRGYWCWILPAAVSARYLRLRITSAQPYLQFGRLWIGDAVFGGVEPDGYQPGAEDSATSIAQRTAQFAMPGLSQTDADAIEAIGLDAGTQRQVLAIARDDRADRTTIVGRFTAIPSPKPRQAWSTSTGSRMHTATIAIREDR